MKRLLFVIIIPIALILMTSCTGNQSLNYKDFPKIDAHVHINTDNAAIIQMADKENFRFLTICVGASSQIRINKQKDFAKKMHNQFPQTLAYVTTFSMEGFEQPGWQEKVIEQLQEDFDNGAVGVKVWKDIGMTFKDSLGNFIMIDDPRFDPIMDFIANSNMTLIAHIGEPRNCWLPLDSMTVNNDRIYFEEHPQYHMYLHPDYPSYESLVAARDQMLAKHPRLRVVGAHLGSLEWSVDELAKRLDRFPKFAVDMSARICHFQVQDREKVRDFILKYQDRLLYATDIGISNQSNPEETKERFRKEWETDWTYFTTGDELNSPHVNGAFKGLDLDEKVLHKIYAENAMKWYPGSFKDKMYKSPKLLALFILFGAFVLKASAKDKKIIIPVENDTFWWIGISNHGEMLPMKNGYYANLEDNYGNQVQPLLLSNHGHVIWSEIPFDVLVENDTLFITAQTSSLIYTKSGTTLKEGFKFASENYFPPAELLPDELLFLAPQYNTWIELIYDQNQKDILDYARQIISNNFSPGVLMIDDNWQDDYGKWDFHPGRFPNPKSMMDSLHQMGFKVMMWICPFVSPDCDVYRKLRRENLLLEDELGQPALVRWWNGASALLDLSKNETKHWFKNQLDYLQENYQVDGFKFDAGDFHHYAGCYSNNKLVSPQEHCQNYASIGLDYPLNEYRAMWKMAGQPLVNRLRDKEHNWEDLQKLIPDILVQGFTGYNFTCPDMVGGGEYGSFINLSTIDQDLIVRSAQCHALMPMMQFSVAPWRILDEQHLNACKKAVQLRMKYTPLILSLAKESAKTGEPIVRSMEYVFPHHGYAPVQNQFLLGDDILVTPHLEKGEGKRTVLIPPGKWENSDGKIFKGPSSIKMEVPIDVLPVFHKVK